MEYRVKSIGAAALLLCVSFAGNALTLGGIRGPVIIGRPLDVTIPVQVEQQDDAAAACFGAEVYHADVRQPAANVRVLVEPTGAAQSIQVRIKSSALVNEPVVSVTLRTRCDLKAERRYVLLADLPKAVDPAIPVQIGNVAASERSPVFISPPVVANSASQVVVVDTPPVKPRQVVRTKMVSPIKEARQSVLKTGDITPKRAVAPSGQSRLQLDNLELFSDRISLIDMEQPDAAPDYVSPDLQKVQDMQVTVDSLQLQLAKKEGSLTALTARLNQSEAERFPAWLVYSLAALILAAVSAIAVLWGRQRRVQEEDGEWWSASVATPDASVVSSAKPIQQAPLVAESSAKPAVKPPLVKSLTSPRVSQWHESKAHEVYVSEVEMGESRFNRFIQSGEVLESSGAASAAAPLDLVLPESESLDGALITELRQQAEFFVALGQTDQAVIVLEKLIHDSEAPNPHVYLDLLGLYHSLSKKMEFQRCREGFNRVFNGAVPEFVSFKSEGRSLDSYPAVLANIVAHWATPEALACINTYVVRSNKESTSTSLDLAAFRELLLLQSIVQQLNAEGVDHMGESSRRQGGAAPLISTPDVEPYDSQFDGMMELDLDLSDVAPDGDSGHDGLSGSNAVPTTIPTGLKANDVTPSQSDNLIDFDLPDIAKPAPRDRKS